MSLCATVHLCASLCISVHLCVSFCHSVPCHDVPTVVTFCPPCTDWPPPLHTPGGSLCEDSHGSQRRQPRLFPRGPGAENVLAAGSGGRHRRSARRRAGRTAARRVRCVHGSVVVDPCLHHPLGLVWRIVVVAADHKYSGSDTASSEAAQKLLDDLKFDPARTAVVREIIDNVSFSKELGLVRASCRCPFCRHSR